MSKLYTGKMIVPKFLTEFRCIGADCPENCCTGWRVDVDRETYNRLHDCPDKALRAELTPVLVVQDATHDALFAYLPPCADKRCPMLLDNGYCKIQSTLGETALPDVCFTYPRSATRAGMDIWQTASLSCPEAARLALSLDDAFDFVHSVQRTRESVSINLLASNGRSVNDRASLRLLTIQVLCTETLPIAHRLVLLAWLSQEIDARPNGKPIPADQLASQTESLLNSGGLDSIVQSSHRDARFAANVFAVIFASPAVKEYSNRQLALTEHVAQILGLNDKPDADRIAACYQEGRRIFAQQPGLLDRILGRSVLSEALVETFPWDVAGAQPHFQTLLIRFGVLRLTLTAMAAGLQRAPTLEEMTDAVSIMHRLYRHNRTFAQNARQLLTESDCLDIQRQILFLLS